MGNSAARHPCARGNPGIAVLPETLILPLARSGLTVTGLLTSPITIHDCIRMTGQPGSARCSHWRRLSHVSPGRISAEVSASTLESHPRHHRGKAPELAPRLEIGQNPANRGFTKQRLLICEIIGILVDKTPTRNRIQLNSRVVARGSTFCRRGGVQCLSLIYCGFPVHSS